MGARVSQGSPLCEQQHKGSLSFRKVVPLVGLEPTTSGLGNRCSIHLSYRGLRLNGTYGTPVMPLAVNLTLVVVKRPAGMAPREDPRRPVTYINDMRTGIRCKAVGPVEGRWPGMAFARHRPA